jgi:hypothetical protein
MSNPLWGTRREVIVSVTLVAFASAAIAAAQWRTRGAAPAADPLVMEDAKGTLGRGGDVQLGPAAAPLFTLEVGSPSVPVGTGGEVGLPEGFFAGGGSGGHGSASYSAGGSAGFRFGADVGNKARPRRSSSGGGGSGVGGGFGFGGGGGAWGGVSGSASTPASTAASAGTAIKSATRASTTVPAPKLGQQTFGSTGGTASGNGGGSAAGSQAGYPSQAAGASFTFKVGEPGLSPAAPGLIAGDPAPDAKGPGSAPTPEPVTLLLVGLGAAALYGARRHFV